MATALSYLQQIDDSLLDSLRNIRSSEINSLNIQISKADKEQREVIKKKIQAVNDAFREQHKLHVKDFSNYRRAAIEIKRAIEKNAPISSFKKIFPTSEMYDRVVELTNLEVLVDGMFNGIVEKEGELSTIINHKDKFSDIILGIMHFDQNDIDDVIKERYDNYRSIYEDRYQDCVNQIAEEDTSELENELARISKILGWDEAKNKEDIAKACKKHYDFLLSQVKDSSSDNVAQVKAYAKRLGLQEQEVGAHILAALDKNKAHEEIIRYNKKINLYSIIAISLLSIIELFTIEWWSILVIPVTVALILFIKKKLLKSE